MQVGSARTAATDARKRRELYHTPLLLASRSEESSLVCIVSHIIISLRLPGKFNQFNYMQFIGDDREGVIHAYL